MRWTDIIELVKISKNENEIGDLISAKTARQVYANKRSVRGQEFYQAQANGLRPELMFEVRIADYEDEEIINYKGKEYSVIRSYAKNSEIIELVCQGVVNNGQV